MKHKGFLTHFLHADGRKRAFCLARFAAAEDGTQQIHVSWEGLLSNHGEGAPPIVKIVPRGDQKMAEAYAQFIGQAPMRLANAIEDLARCRQELSRFEGETWRGQAVAIEDATRGGVWLYGPEIISLPDDLWGSHFAMWFASWDALADELALSPCGVGVTAGGTPYVRLAPYRKPRIPARGA